MPMSRVPRFHPATAALALWAALALPGVPAAAQTYQAASGEIDSKLPQSLKQLAATRERIAVEKIPLSTSVSNLENEVLQLRQERARLLKVRDSRTIDLTSLRHQVESLSEQDDFVNSRLNEFVRDFEGRLDISELPRYQARTAAAKLAEKNVNLDAGGKRDAQVAVVEAALERLRAQLGGEVFAGSALSPEGVLTAGKFVSFGPTVFYVSDDGVVSGLVENQLNAADPVVVGLPNGDGEVARVAADGRGSLLFDATLGKALKIEKAEKSLLDHIEDGGPVGYVICVLGVVAIALTGFKLREITGFAVPTEREVDGVLRDLAQGDSQAAAARAERIPGVSGEMLATGVRHAQEKRSVLEELLFEKILRARPELERFLPFLAITAAAAPLLGLLGTVIGMIKTFQLITIFGTGDAKSLSSGISEALITTALGLIVAIPVLVLHGALARMARRKLSLLEEISTAFVNGVAALRGEAAPAEAQPGWQELHPRGPAPS